MISDFGKRIDGPGGRRRAPRERLLLQAAMDTVSARGTATLKDISETGARIGGNDLPDIGQEVLIKTNGCVIFGQIAWRRGKECGVHFDEPVAPESLADLRCGASQFMMSHLSPEEAQAADDWRHGLAR